MPETYCARAIVLSRRPYRGYDNRVSVYSRERGKLELLVKGARRPASKLAAHLEPLTLLDLMVVSSKIPFAGAAVSRDCYPHLKSDFEKVSAAGAAIGRLNRLLKEHIADEELFSLTEDFLHILDTHTAEESWYQWISNMFLYKVLERLGYGINFATYIPEKGQPRLVPEAKSSLVHTQNLSLNEIAKLKVLRKPLAEMNTFLEVWIRNISEF